MEFGAAFPTDGEALELVTEGEGLLDDGAELAEALDVRAALAGDDRQDSALAQFAVGIGVVALVSEEGLGAAGSARAAGDGRDDTRLRRDPTPKIVGARGAGLPFPMPPSPVHPTLTVDEFHACADRGGLGLP